MQTAPVMQVYQVLLSYYGEQHWWPAESAFEMMVGAILTQNTNWNNVEKALHNLRNADAIHPDVIITSNRTSLEAWIRPAGFFRQKSNSLIHLSKFYLQYGNLEGMKQAPLKHLRKALLNVHGIGPETADSILLYGTDKTIFVIDSYTKRIFHRLGILPETIHTYDNVQKFFQCNLPTSLALYQQYHALIVIHAKEHCRKHALCSGCPLLHACQYRNNHKTQEHNPYVG